MTSGTQSPCLNKVICMGYVPSAQASEAQGWEVAISQRRYSLRVTPLPFYSRTRAT